MAENYNKFFKRYYGIDFGKEYVVHHIDGDHSNDCIANLMLLPRGLHSKYHELKKVIESNRLPTEIRGNQLSNATIIFNCYKRFLAILNECNEWYDYKMFLDGKLPNIHGIRL